MLGAITLTKSISCLIYFTLKSGSFNVLKEPDLTVIFLCPCTLKVGKMFDKQDYFSVVLVS